MSVLPTPGSLALGGARHAIDRVDDALLLLLAARRRIVSIIAPLKRHAGVPLRDPNREREVRIRAQRWAERLDVPDATAQRLVGILIHDACRQQGLVSDLDQCARADEARIMASVTTPLFEYESPPAHPLLRLLPPPRRMGVLLRMIPRRWQAQGVESAIGHALVPLLNGDALSFMPGRRLGIEVSDLGMCWTFEVRDGCLRTCDEAAEATVRGCLTDLLLLASRLEDADTLFFQRRLVLIGDTELGLTIRNVLDRLSWEEVPLGLRIALNRLARLARAARAAHRRSA